MLIGQIGKDRKIYAAFGKTLGVLGHAELFEPVGNLLHRRGPAELALTVPDRSGEESTINTNTAYRLEEGSYTG